MNICFYKFFILEIIVFFVNSKSNNKKRNLIHFIKCGNSDAILIQGNKHFGLIDSSFPSKINKNINQFLNIDKKNNVMIIIKYLKKLKVKKLDFIIGTHAHIDHLGGISSISKKYVNEKTKYFYKEYKNYKDILIKKNYLIAINSMKKKNAQLIEVTNKKINFNLGEMNIELLNTFIDKNLYLDDNQNSIMTLIKFKNTKVLLPGDMTKI